MDNFGRRCPDFVEKKLLNKKISELTEHISKHKSELESKSGEFENLNKEYGNLRKDCGNLNLKISELGNNTNKELGNLRKHFEMIQKLSDSIQGNYEYFSQKTDILNTESQHLKVLLEQNVKNVGLKLNELQHAMSSEISKKIDVVKNDMSSEISEIMKKANFVKVEYMREMMQKVIDANQSNLELKFKELENANSEISMKIDVVKNDMSSEISKKIDSVKNNIENGNTIKNMHNELTNINKRLSNLEKSRPGATPKKS